MISDLQNWLDWIRKAFFSKGRALEFPIPKSLFSNENTDRVFSPNNSPGNLQLTLLQRARIQSHTRWEGAGHRWPWMRAETEVVKWIAERLRMGAPGYVNHLLYRRLGVTIQ